MTVAEAMRRISSPEYAEWAAFYALEAAEADPDRTPTPDELAAKMRALGSGGAR
jgi:hypothetical protein